MSDTLLPIFVFLILVTLILLFAATIKIVQPYQNGVAILFGAYKRTLGPGMHFLHPLFRVIRVDMRTRNDTVGPFPAPMANGIPVAVVARVEYRVADAAASVLQTTDLSTAIREELKIALSGAVLQTSPETVHPKGVVVADRAKVSLSKRTSKIGVNIGRVIVGVEGPVGFVEYSSGEALT
jgi:regulator of protease activity HflC (stomatin/prohibitin superfamily)